MILVVPLAVVAVSCANGDDGSSIGIGRPAESTNPLSSTDPTTTATTTTAAATTPPGSATTVPSTPPPITTPPTTTMPPLQEPEVELVEIGTFDQPVDVVERIGQGELFVVEQPGRVLAVTDLSSEVVLDISELTVARGEQGLLGLAFHPTADLAYVDFTDRDGDTVVAEFAIDPVTGVFDRDSYREVLTVDQPFSNHNGGQLTFGPDQFLYIGLGDGGSSDDPRRVALDLSSRLGKILRIDPIASGAGGFSIPPDNPFVGDPAADPAIWALGLRNPWRFSFDPVTGDLWIGDVGQREFEEINRSSATDRRDAGRGVNYGWSAFEGFEPFNEDQVAVDAEPPLFVYPHTDGRCSVTGGAVVRNDAVADLTGWYLFGDYCTGEIWALDPSADPSDPRVVEIAQLEALVALSPGPGGDFYAVSNSGAVARFVAS